MTPRQLEALLARRRAEMEHREVLAAQIAEKVVNWGFRAPREAAKISDFMPSRWSAAPAAESVELTDELRASIANSWRMMCTEVVPAGNPGAI